MDFYNQLSATYDLMTRFEDRYQNEEKILQLWREKLNFKSAIDVACGTGLHTIILTKMGIKTTGIDLSAQMLHQAKLNAKRFSVSIPWIQSSLTDLKQKVKTRFDVLFCLGNSIPHILTLPELEQAFRNFYEVLNPGGAIVLQLLNYVTILKQKNRIVGIHRKGDLEFIRFYDFLEKQLRFNILTVEKKEQGFTHSLQSTLLFPYKKNDLKDALKRTNFSGLEFFGDMNCSHYNKDESANLVILARKSQAPNSV